jgi:hypothetical protein
MMHGFIFALAKHILTAGFVCGVLSIVVRVLDERLSQGTKDRFGAWVNSAAPVVGAWNVNRLYSYMRRYRWVIWSLLSVVVFSIAVYVWFGSFSYELDFEELTFGVLALLGVFAVCAYVFHEPFKEETFAGARAALLRRLRSKEVGITESNFIFTVVILVLMVQAICMLVILIPITLVSKAVWWLAIYPKGPWAGLVFMVTIVLGVFRLFL